MFKATLNSCSSRGGQTFLTDVGPGSGQQETNGRFINPVSFGKKPQNNWLSHLK